MLIVYSPVLFLSLTQCECNASHREGVWICGWRLLIFFRKLCLFLAHIRSSFSGQDFIDHKIHTKGNLGFFRSDGFVYWLLSFSEMLSLVEVPKWRRILSALSRNSLLKLLMNTIDCYHTALLAFCLLCVQLFFSGACKTKSNGFVFVFCFFEHLAEGHLLLGLDFSYHMFHILYTFDCNETGIATWVMLMNRMCVFVFMLRMRVLEHVRLLQS